MAERFILCYYFMPYKSKEAAKEYKRQYYLANKEKFTKERTDQDRANDRAYNLANKEKRKAWRQANKERARKYVQARFKEDPIYRLKVNTRTLLHQAVKDGRVKKLPCEVCGDVKSEAHHNDYSKPFEVKWFCKKHHLKYHDILKNA